MTSCIYAQIVSYLGSTYMNDNITVEIIVSNGDFCTWKREIESEYSSKCVLFRSGFFAQSFRHLNDNQPAWSNCDRWNTGLLAHSHDYELTVCIRVYFDGKRRCLLLKWKHFSESAHVDCECAEEAFQGAYRKCVLLREWLPCGRAPQSKSRGIF